MLMVKSELIERLAQLRADIPCQRVERAINVLFEHMSETLTRSERIEIPGGRQFFPLCAAAVLIAQPENR